MQEIDCGRRSTFADTLDLLLPHLPPALVTQEAVFSLQSAARLLPPIPHGGFECRLQSESPQVDIQQSIYAKDNEPAILHAHLAALTAVSSTPLDPAWQRISKFCEEWNNSKSTLHSAISEIWLELDLPEGTQTPISAPSVFIGLTRTVLSPENVLAVVNRSLDLILGAPLSAKREISLMRCLNALPGKSHLRHFGVMASRPSAELRVNLQNLSADRITAYLKQCGWPGKADELDSLIAECYAECEGVTVCLDVDESIMSQVGLECFFAEPEAELRWPSMLARLVDRGICTPEKRDALLSWPGSITPVTASAPWPDHLIGAALAQPADRFSLLDRRLHHLKLTYCDERAVTAKAYFGAVHDWRHNSQSIDGDGMPIPFGTAVGLKPRGLRSDRTVREQIDRAIANATKFLLGARLKGGWWQEYPDCWGGPSVEFSTAYVAHALSGLSDERANRAAWWSWLLLSRSRRDAIGIGWSRQTPTDADSTGWWLQLARALGRDHLAPFQQFERFVGQHVLASGGLVSYTKHNFYHGCPPEDLGEISDWFDEHLCVTAVVANLPAFAEQCCVRLRETQRSAGNWRGYWWDDDEYTTALATEALAASGNKEDQERVSAASVWAMQRVNKAGAVCSPVHGDASAFATAGCVQLLSLIPDQQARDCLDHACLWLLEQQESNGSWAPSAWCRYPKLSSPDHRMLDYGGTMTTATVLKALRAVSSRRHP